MTRQRKDGTWASERKGLRGPDGAPGRDGGQQPTPVQAAAGIDQVPRDHRGFPLKGGALQGYRERQAAINEALLARQAVKSMAQAVMVLASRLTGLPGPEGVRALMSAAGVDGLDHALAVTRAAGHDVPAQASQWRAEAPVQRQASRGTDWSTDPDHSPVVMEAIMRGASADELNRIRSAAATEREAGRQRQERQSSVMWRTRSGDLLDDTGGEPRPFQRSIVEREWDSFPDHAPPQPGSETAASAVPHGGQPSIWNER